MEYSLKAVLKSLNVLFISKKDDITTTEMNILNMFFNKIIFSISCDKGYKAYLETHPDIIIIDLDYENDMAIKFCKNIKKINSSIPIIVISKSKEEKLLFEAIRLQVVDYVLRPIKAEKLIYALNETAKKVLNQGGMSVKLTNNLYYNYKEKSIIDEKQQKIKLTKNEYRLLELLLLNRNTNISKEEIERHLWADEPITESAFKSLFSRLRQKVGKDTIKNSFGIGYQLV
ncbi:hypothetical protein CRV08_03560 [Halarcobacter ebronensis]|uniref:DNA-binding response regulator n=1 Tax=Halarcobacter ebronensis TaxID=1462615 RepID=A0A4Q0YGJ8_9BACT|nr:winged helix-turn-helix domain-containing protein [Halarcobacter ebronensis]RXJ69796.1 hypothetical protein CRV08_03560 [Halarcobacter ebronensis]